MSDDERIRWLEKALEDTMRDHDRLRAAIDAIEARCEEAATGHEFPKWRRQLAQDILALVRQGKGENDGSR